MLSQLSFLQTGCHATCRRALPDFSSDPNFLGPSRPPLVHFTTLCKKKFLLSAWWEIQQVHDLGERVICPITGAIIFGGCEGLPPLAVDSKREMLADFRGLCAVMF
jgi:hypothetical protein